jgi:hypothetical protein
VIQDAPKLCPPHHWEVTTVRADNTAFHHHRCIRCEAQKDVPIGITGNAGPWRINNKKAAPSG